jgi:hypothetical protein
MIAIVALRPNVILSRQCLFSPQTEPPLFIFWANMTNYSKKYPFATAFKFGLKEIFAKGKTGQAISYRDSRLSAQSADGRLVNNSISYAQF